MHGEAPGALLASLWVCICVCGSGREKQSFCSIHFMRLGRVGHSFILSLFLSFLCSFTYIEI